MLDESMTRSILLKESIKDETMQVKLSLSSIKVALNEKIKTGLSGKKLLETGANSSKHTITEMLRVVKHSPKFGLDTLIFKILILLLSFSFIQAVHFFAIYPRAQRVTYLTKAYSLSVDIWSSYYRTLTLFTEVIAWNNTIKGGKGEPIFDTFKESVKYIENEILYNITESKKYDLGSFTQEYSDIYFKVFLIV